MSFGRCQEVALTQPAAIYMTIKNIFSLVSCAHFFFLRRQHPEELYVLAESFFLSSFLLYPASTNELKMSIQPFYLCFYLEIYWNSFLSLRLRPFSFTKIYANHVGTERETFDFFVPITFVSVLMALFVLPCAHSAKLIKHIPGH